MTASTSSGSDGGGGSLTHGVDAVDIALDVVAWVVAVALFFTLLRLRTAYQRRRKGYREIQQDDRGLYSSTLMTAKDSWETMPAQSQQHTDDESNADRV